MATAKELKELVIDLLDVLDSIIDGNANLSDFAESTIARARRVRGTRRGVGAGMPVHIVEGNSLTTLCGKPRERRRIAPDLATAETMASAPQSPYKGAAHVCETCKAGG